MIISYVPKGVCAHKFTIHLSDGVVQRVEVEGGCDGNLKGISELVAGMRAEDVVSRLEGLTCGRKPTSCPDQLANALRSQIE